MKTASSIIEGPAPILTLHRASKPDHCERVRLLMAMFGLSLSDVVGGCGKALSKTQLHRILHGQSPTAFEKRAIATGIIACLQDRCDSAFLFDGEKA
jgi:antitoxin component HigA of HigAB toxin-antitoxin module